MAIDDPTAIPQTTDQIAEYMQEADRLWYDNRTEEAHTLYRSVYSAQADAPDPEQDWARDMLSWRWPED